MGLSGRSAAADSTGSFAVLANASKFRSALPATPRRHPGELDHRRVWEPPPRPVVNQQPGQDVNGYSFGAQPLDGRTSRPESPHRADRASFQEIWATKALRGPNARPRENHPVDN